MKVNIIISTLVISLMVAAGTIFYTKLPYYNETLILLGISILIMGVIKENYIFLYGIIVILSFGTFLTIEAFTNTTSNDTQVIYMYIHLLATTFLLLYWVLLHYLKTIGNQNRQLKEQIKRLSKYDTHYKVLTVHEFIDQSKMICKIATRRNEELWLLKVHIHSENKSTEQNLKETLSEIILESTRGEFDIVTLNALTIYALLQNTNKTGVETVQKRIQQNSEQFFNGNHDKFHFTYLSVQNVEEIINETKGD